MMAFFLIVLGVPLAIAALAFTFLNGITLKEFGCIVGVQLLVAGSSAGICSCANTHDVEVWNGRVAKKYSEQVSCEHSYTCNCITTCTGGKNSTCTTVCQTCHEHSYDVDWDVVTTNGEKFSIERVNRQGTHEPPRWSTVFVGEPTSREHSYKNYVKASPGTLFRYQGLKQKYDKTLPKYPQDVYDYYRLNRLVTVGLTVPDVRDWNASLSELNADLGRAKQANVIVVIARDVSLDWYYALEESWIGGKKNDVVLVVSVDAAMRPQWTAVMCWTTNELFKVRLRDDVMNDHTVTREAIIADLRTNVSQYFERKPMKDFEYLSSSITPTTTEWWVTMIIGLVIALSLITFFEVADPFGDDPQFTSMRRRSLNNRIHRG